MSQNIAELLELLIEDLYGGLSSTIFSTLFRHGRLSLFGLSHYSGLNPTLLRPGLVVLIQHHLVFHYTTLKNDTAVYEADWGSAYALVRAGKAIKVIGEKFGEAASELASNLQLNGHIRVQDLAEAFDNSLKKKNHVISEEPHVNGDGLPNGIGEHHAKLDDPRKSIDSVDQMHETLLEFRRCGYLVSVTERSFLSPADFQTEAEYTLAQAKHTGGPKGRQARAEFLGDMNKLKRKWRDGEDDSTHITTKASKKRKTNGTFTNGVNGIYQDIPWASVAVDRLDNDIAVRLSHEKIAVDMRTRRLVDLSARYLGEITSKVYQGLLDILGEKISRCYDEYEDAGEDEAQDEADEDDGDRQRPTRDEKLYATSADVLDRLAPDLDLSNGIATDKDFTSGVNGVREGAIQSQYKPPVSHSDEDDSLRLMQVERHMQLLSDDPREFTVWNGSGGAVGGRWSVPFRQVSTYLIQQEIEDTVTARFGSQAARIIRILHDKGRLDEKQVSHFSMTRNKDIRSMLTAMQEAGFVEIQEVPKDNSRQPSRTIYLWFYDQDRVRRLLLNDTYKCMARLLQRAKHEKAERKSLLDKAERTDVVGHEDQYLTDLEREGLRKWQSIEEKLLVQLGRQDDVVATLRDFLPEVAI